MLTLSTATSIGILTALIGWTKILFDNRTFLSFYTLFCWITFAFLVIPGYLPYKPITFNLEGKVNALLSRQLGVLERLRIQSDLQYCGYFGRSSKRLSPRRVMRDPGFRGARALISGSSGSC